MQCVGMQCVCWRPAPLRQLAHLQRRKPAQSLQSRRTGAAERGAAGGPGSGASTMMLARLAACMDVAGSSSSSGLGCAWPNARCSSPETAFVTAAILPHTSGQSCDGAQDADAQRSCRRQAGTPVVVRALAFALA